MKKHALIIGGSSGIGLAIVQAFNYEGFKVSVVGRNDCNLKNFKKIYLDIKFFKADLLRSNYLPQLFKSLEKKAGNVDILVNCAGYLPPLKLIKDLNIAELDKTININVRTPFLFCQMVLPYMLVKKSGVIINLLSRAAVNPVARWSAYSMSKAALLSFSQTLNNELKDMGISVYSVNPGATRTNMRKKAFPQENPFKLPHPLETVGIYVYLVKNQPPAEGGMLDTYDWLNLHHEWREYGNTLKKVMEDKHGILY